MSGATAFGWSLLRCVDPLGLVSRRPGSGFAVILLAFAVAGAVFALQPLQYTWIGAGIRFIWVTPPDGIAYFLPNALALMAGLALLPTILLATAAGWGRLRLLAVMTVTLAAMILVEGWAAPAAMRARDRRAGEQLQEMSSGRDVRLYADTAKVVALAYGSDRQLAPVARQELRNLAHVIAMSVSFALVGFALGRTRWQAFRNPGVLLLAACWFVGWTTYQALGYWGQYLVVLLGLPGATGSWVGPLVFTLTACAVILATRTGGAETPPRDEALRA
jgi:hypothetical protein